MHILYPVRALNRLKAKLAGAVPRGQHATAVLCVLNI
jgi:hypothetical protein